MKPIRNKNRTIRKKFNGVMVATPISDRKLYCWLDYVDSIKKITGVDEIVICDTSQDLSMKQKIIDEGFTFLFHYEVKPMDRVVAARNKLINYALDHGYRWILFIDADIIAEPNIAEKLKSNKVPVVTGLGIIMDSNNLPIPSAKFLKDGNYYAFPKESLDGETHEVDLIGLGCCLIHKSVAELIPIRCERDDHEGKLVKSEDHCFSLDCNAKGIKLFFDTSVRTKHKIAAEAHWDFDTA